MNIATLRLAAVLVLVALAGCAAWPDGAEGRLTIEGGNALLNGRPVSGTPYVFAGDKIATGAGTSVRIRLRQGGSIVLDENTDPRLVREGLCLLIKVFYGRLLADGNGLCIEDPNLSGVLNSRINLRTDPASGVSEVTVIEGRFDVNRPRPISLGRFERLVVERGAARPVQQLDAREAQAAQAWAQAWAPPVDSGWCCRDGRVFEATEAQCSRSGDRHRPSRRAAEAVCTAAPPPPPAQGWCCRDKEVFEASAEQCRKQGGRHEQSRFAAARACGDSPAPQGWCCRAGNVFQSTTEQCRRPGDQHRTSRQAAEAACKPVIR